MTAVQPAASFDARSSLTLFKIPRCVSCLAPPDAEGKAAAQTAQMIAASQDVKLGHIKTSELALDKNPIPASALALLHPILDQ